MCQRFSLRHAPELRRHHVSPKPRLFRTLTNNQEAKICQTFPNQYWFHSDHASNTLRHTLLRELPPGLTRLTTNGHAATGRRLGPRAHRISGCVPDSVTAQPPSEMTWFSPMALLYRWSTSDCGLQPKGWFETISQPARSCNLCRGFHPWREVSSKAFTLQLSTEILSGSPQLNSPLRAPSRTLESAGRQQA